MEIELYETCQCRECRVRRGELLPKDAPIYECPTEITAEGEKVYGY